MRWKALQAALAVIACLNVVNADDTDPAYLHRLGLNPYVYYDFRDAAEAGNGAQPTRVKDRSNRTTDHFGDLLVNPNRNCTWTHGASGSPGLHVDEVDSTNGANPVALESENGFSDALHEAMNASGGFTIEMWVDMEQDVNGDNRKVYGVFELGKAGAAADVHNCGANDNTLIEMTLSDQIFLTRVDYGGACGSKDVDPQGYGTKMLAFSMRSVPESNFGQLVYRLTTQVSQGQPQPAGSQGYLAKNNLTNLLLGVGDTTASAIDLTYYSFAIYPLLNFTQIQALYAQGLPNAAPRTRSFARSVPQQLLDSTGAADANSTSSLPLCPDQAGTDATCLDATMAAKALPFSTVRTVANVTLETLPARGTLSYEGQALTSADLPFVMGPHPTVHFTPALGEHSFLVAGADFGQDVTWSQSDYANFTYTATDAQNATSAASTVTLSVFPRHVRPAATAMAADDVAAPKVFAGATAQTNEFTLSGTVNQAFSAAPGCVSSTACKEMPAALLAYATVTELPAKGTLYHKRLVTGGVTYNESVRVGDRIAIPDGKVYYQVSATEFNGTAEDLGTLNFSYTVTDYFSYQATGLWGSVTGSQTRYPQSLSGETTTNFLPNATSEAASVTFVVKNGLYAESNRSTVRQLTTPESQALTVSVRDKAEFGGETAVWVASLPAKGTLFDAAGAAVLGSALPTQVGTLAAGATDLPLTYNPGERGGNVTDPYAFGVGFASFTFYGTKSNGTIKSGTGTTMIDVTDSNDPPALVSINCTQRSKVLTDDAAEKAAVDKCEKILWTLPAGADAQEFDNVAEEYSVYVDFEDPDLKKAGEPYYVVTVEVLDDAPLAVFLKPSVVEAMNAVPGGLGRIAGNRQGGSALLWQIVVSRDDAWSALNPFRVRVQKSGKNLKIKVAVTDMPTADRDARVNTAPYSTWTPKQFSQEIVIDVEEPAGGSGADSTNPWGAFSGDADPLIVGLVWGGMGLLFIFLVACIGYCVVKSCGGVCKCCKAGARAGKRAGKRGAGRSPAYLTTVDVEM